MSVGFPDADCPADPYPGTVPPCSYVHADGVAHRLIADSRAASGWRVGEIDLDGWLGAHDAPLAAERVPVLAYGSNRCPSKITWLRRTLGLTGPVVVLRARTDGVAAVWAHGFRRRDGQRPAVLAAAPRVLEEHAVWLTTPAQVAVLDRCEGRGERFRLARLRTGTVHTEDGARIVAPWCYLGCAPTRRPLLVGGTARSVSGERIGTARSTSEARVGTMVRCAEVPQAVARELHGDPAASDGLDAATVEGTPHPDEWPAALFAYGLLQPGQPSWPLIAAYAADAPRRAAVPGAVFDTGHSYPALLPGRSGTALGTVVPLHDPATLLSTLDSYEGPDYRRVRLVIPADGTVCWAYTWRGPIDGLTPLPNGWPRPAAPRPASSATWTS